MEDQSAAKSALDDDKLLEARYIGITDRMREKELSLTDLTL